MRFSGMLCTFIQRTLLVLTISIFVQSSSWAQDFPNRAITLIVPTAAGGPIDLTARIVAKELTLVLGQPIVVVNRPGASQKIGIDSLLKAPLDGYTIAAVSPASMTINPLLNKSISYNPLKDFTYLVNAIEYPSLLVVHPKIPVRNLVELVAFGRKNPGKLTYGSGGSGSSIHFTTAAVLGLAGVDALHVPYTSSGPAMIGLLSDEISLLMPDMADVRQHVASGSLIPIAASGKERSNKLPNVPTFAESNVPELKNWTYTGWIGFVAAAGVPAEAANRLQSALMTTMLSTKVKESFDNIGFKVIASNAQQFSEQIQDGLDGNRKIMGLVNITR